MKALSLYAINVSTNLICVSLLPACLLPVCLFTCVSLTCVSVHLCVSYLCVCSPMCLLPVCLFTCVSLTCACTHLFVPKQANRVQALTVRMEEVALIMRNNVETVRERAGKLADVDERAEALKESVSVTTLLVHKVLRHRCRGQGL